LDGGGEPIQVRGGPGIDSYRKDFGYVIAREFPDRRLERAELLDESAWEWVTDQEILDEREAR
jgi:hypothetical protein